MTLYLVRHGLAAAGLDDLDPGLAPLGREQAQAAAGALARLTPARLAVSPLRRTRETAEPFARAFGMEPEVRAEVAEFFDPDTPPAERQAIIGPFMEGRWSAQSAKLRAWRERALAALRELGAGGDAVVVSHYIAICAAIGAATDDDRVVPVKLANASITTLEAGADGLALTAAGAIDHLAPEQVTGLATALPGGP